MPKSVPYSEAVQELINTIPEFRELYEDVQGGIFRDLPHPIVGAIAVFVVSLFETPEENNELLGRIFRVVEMLAQSEDFKTRSLVQTSFLENLGKTPSVLESSRQFMGARTRNLSDEIEAFWNKGECPKSWPPRTER